MIHDSYATHAPNMATMNEELRKAFVDMYRGLDVNTLAAGIVAETGEASTTGERFEAPTVDLTGTLDIDDVLKATYFFT